LSHSSSIYSLAKVRKIVEIWDECNYLLIFEAVIANEGIMKKIVLLIGFIVCGLIGAPVVKGQSQLWNGGNGGAGTWNATNTNWEANSGGAGAWQGGIAHFPKTGGTVQVESTKEIPLFFQQLNFLVGSYVLKDGYLAIKKPGENNNGYVIVPKDNSAEIKSVIMDGGAINALIKQGKGQLILSGDNLHTGGTYVTEGELVVSKDENLGKPVSSVVLEGGTLTIIGDDFNLTERTFNLGIQKCTLAISSAANTLEITKLLDIKTSFYKDGPGTLVAPINSLWSGDIIVLDGKLQFKNTEWEWAEILPVNIKAGTLSLSSAKEKGIKLENISGNGTLEKEGEGTLLLEGTNPARGQLIHREGIIQLKSDWNGDYDKMNGTRLNIANGVNIHGNAILRDTIVQDGTITWRSDLELNKAVFKLGSQSEIIVGGDLSFTDMNTIVLDKEPEIPLSLMRVKGSHPSDSETESQLQIKIKKRLLDNPDYIFTWYENELFLRDKNKPFPLEYKVSLNPSEDIELYDLKPGDYTFTHGESISFTFLPKDNSYPAAAVLFLVNGEETPFRDLGEGYRYRYSITSIAKDHDIYIGIKTLEVKAPVVKGATITSASGEWGVRYGEGITFTLTLDKEYNESEVKVFANKEVLTPTQVGEGKYTYTLDSVTEPVSLRVLGVKLNDPTSNIEAEKKYPQISSVNGALIIEMDSVQPIVVYSLTGRVCAEMQSQTGRVEIPLSRGIYIARIGTEAYKVVVR